MKRLLVGIGFVLVVTLVFAAGASAVTESVVVNCENATGSCGNPKQGNRCTPSSDGTLLYCTSRYGGAYSRGIVFSMDASGNTTTLTEAFGGDFGQQSPIVMGPDGNWYGTTWGDSAIYKLSYGNGQWTYTHLVGVPPSAGLLGEFAVTNCNWSVCGGDIYLYASTWHTSATCSSIVRYDITNNTLTTLYTFTGGNDGCHVQSGVILGPAAPAALGSEMVCGTSYDGGVNGNGTVFCYDFRVNSLQLVHVFAGGASDGANPAAAPTFVSSCVPGYGCSNDIYGTTVNGGSHGLGTLWKITGSTGAESLLHHFAGYQNNDGSAPYSPLFPKPNSSPVVLYGTTSTGGNGGTNDGSVYHVIVGGSYVQDYAFLGGTADGYNPLGAISFFSGDMFTMTNWGGTGPGCGLNRTGCGTVVKIVP